MNYYKLTRPSAQRESVKGDQSLGHSPTIFIRNRPKRALYAQGPPIEGLSR